MGSFILKELSVSRDNYTALPFVGVLVTDVHIILSNLYIKNEKLLNSNNRSKPEFVRLLWDIIVFRLVACWLKII